PKELAFADLFQYFMLEQGIHLWGSLRCFLSTAHQPADLEQIVAAASATLAKMEEGGFLEPAEEPSATSPRQERQGTETSPTPSIDVAQTLDTAQTLAQIWSTLLGVEEVGPDDDFFALGGDSLMAIQAVDMARRSGIALSQFQMVDHPRLADLARVAQGTEGSDSGESDVIDTGGDEAPASGPVPLMPYQDYFLAEIDTPNPHHWNVTVLYAVPRRFDRAALARAVESLVHRHDALRLRFIPQGDRWQQVYSEASDAIPLSVIDLGRVAEGGRRSALETAADQAQRSLLLGQGPTVRFVYFELADSKRDRLLFVAHHLVIDNISVDILIDDLQTAYARLERGQTPDLPATTASFQAWAERLAGYAQAPVLEAELGYWLGLPWSQTGRLPVDLPAGENTTLSGQTVELTISQPKTTILLRHVTRRFTVKPEEIFLTALLLALVRWTGRPEHVIGLLHHGREPLFEDLDVSRTVGGFNSHYQVVLGLDDTDDIAQALQSVSSQRRQIPHNGLGFGVLRHLSRDLETVDRLKALPPADVF
ncbi:MAG: condensation domain-containing protein, partial [Acidobacteriota bacterium]